MATFEIITSPIGSQFTDAIDADDPDDQNDFSVFITSDENVSGFEQSDCSVNNNASIVSFEGENSVYIATVRPPETAAVVTFTIAADAVAEGNAETTQDIRVSTAFPDADAEAPTTLFSHGIINGLARGMTLTPTRILIYDRTGHDLKLFTHAGAEQSSEEIDTGIGIGTNIEGIDFINGDILIGDIDSNVSGVAARYRIDGNSLELVERYSDSFNPLGITHTRLGITGYVKANNQIKIQAYSGTAVSEYDLDFIGDNSTRYLAHQSDLLYLLETSLINQIQETHLLQITDSDEIELVRRLNIQSATISSLLYDLAIYRDTLYVLQLNDVLTLDIRQYRPMAKNTKELIHPVIVTGATTIDLTQYAPDAHTIIFDVGFDLPSYLSIANNTLTVDTSGITSPTPCFVMLKGLNYVDATETGSFGFYLIILPATAPVWNSVTELTLRADATYNLHLLVNAESIAFRSGRTQPTGSSLDDGIFTIGTASGTAEFTATKDGLDSHKSIAIDVIQDAANFRNTQFRYKVEIAGIDVSADLLNAPTISENLDPIAINETRINEATIVLSGVAKYDPNRAGNFWRSNGLNAGGFQERVKVYTEHLIAGVWTENLLFSGIILESAYPVDRAEFRLNCVDASHTLQNIVPRDFGRLEKWAETRKTTEEATFEGTYSPNNSLLPIQPKTGQAWTDRTPLTLTTLQNQSEGVVPANTGYLTAQDFRTAGGFVDTNPTLNYKTLPLSSDIELLMQQLTVGDGFAYNIEIDLTGKTVDMPYVLNRGNVPRNVQETRNTLLLTDWVYDATADRIVMLLSNSEGHIQDVIAEYSLSQNAYRVLHRLPKDVKAHRIERRNSTNYYLLTSGAITQDRSATQTPRQSDKTAYGYDSVAEGSTCRTYHFNASTRTLTALVDENNARPPQVGIQYYVGFENDFNIDEFEGIRPDYRGAFKWYSNNLYYRYATDSEFGVARVNTSGTTSEMISQTRSEHWDHLNFAFDIDTSGDVYFGYATQSTHLNTLTLKRRTAGGTESTLLADTQSIGDNAYLGVHELLFHSDFLYMILPIQNLENPNGNTPNFDPDFIIEEIGTRKTRYVTTSTNLNPTNTRLDPGEDIPIRIDFNSSISGATQSDLTVYGATIQSFSTSSDMIDITLRPDDLTEHKNIVIDLAEDAVTRGNAETRIVVDFGTRRSRMKTARAMLCRVNTRGTPALEVIEEYDFVNQSACNLTVYDGAVYFTEVPPASEQYQTQS